MYDHYSDPWNTSPYAPADPQSDVVTHLVFVGGRLAESWSEEAGGSKYAEFARSLAQERRRVEPPPKPPEPLEPAHVLLLAWLDEQAGDRDCLMALTGDALTDALTDVPETDRACDHQRLLAVAELLDGCANVLLRHEEWGNACRRALPVLWETDSQVLTQAPSAAHAAAGIVWALGKANGWFPASGYSICTQSTLRDHFGLTAYASAYGKTVQGALRVSLPARLHWDWRRSTPDLVALGRPDLLTATTRRTLIRLRDQALVSERIAAGEQLDQAG